jgi:hypothetical protein
MNGQRSHSIWHGDNDEDGDVDQRRVAVYRTRYSTTMNGDELYNRLMIRTMNKWAEKALSERCILVVVGDFNHGAAAAPVTCCDNNTADPIPVASQLSGLGRGCGNASCWQDSGVKICGPQQGDHLRAR